jgi:hypothetical protein
MTKYKEVLYLLNKYKYDEEGFKDAYFEKFKRTNNIILNDKDKPEEQLTSYLSEEISISIDTRIIGDLIWMGKDDYLKGLREDKLKRILGEE